MPETEGRGDLDLAEIAIEEEVTTDKAQLDTDTDELIDWVFGTEVEDTASEKDTASVEDNDELGNSSE